MLLGTLPAITFCWWFGTLGTFSIPVHWSKIHNNSYFLEHVFTFYRLKSQKTICMYVSCYSIKQYVWLQFIMRFILNGIFYFYFQMLEVMGIILWWFLFPVGGLKNPNWFCQNSHLGWSLSPGHWPIGLAVMNQKKNLLSHYCCGTDFFKNSNNNFFIV